MLGKLFNLGAGSGPGALPSPQPSSHRPYPLESVQEDIHTRHLLFPDPQDLYEHRVNQLYPLSSGVTTPTGSSANAFDYNADIELDVRDVRIIIMQDALSSVAASLLYDSQPAPPPRRTPVSPRKPSVSYSQRPIVIQPGSPKIRQGAFDRRPSVHSRNQGYVESESQRAWREYREELATFSSCIFGNSELMAYKGTSTKVHVVPSDVRPSESSSMFGDGRGSLGRSTMRASRLSQSFSSENPPPFPTPPTPSRNQDRKKVLITRLFPVNLPLDEGLPSLHGTFSEEATGYPFPQSVEDMKAKKKRFQPRQKRTPMYAVALIITLPPSAHSVPATLRSAFKGPSSYAEQDSFPSSFSSTRRSGWTLVGQGGFAGPESFESSYGNDMEDQIDAITQHWDIIMRTLSHLQTVVAATLFTMLRQIDLASPDPLPALSLQLARASSAPGRRSEDGQPVKPPKTNAKHITLLPNCLLDNRKISTEMDAAKTRIVAGIRASRVTTGQNRWPIWREEARWVAKWAGGREQGFFFFNLLTGFLATHTDWLQALSPPAYRRRHLLQQQKGRSEEDTLVPSRTIILGDDKIAARRLVFLLSAFLPASQQLPGIKANRPSTPASFSALSQSPPSFVVPILKEESLRRKINRRTGSRMPSHSRNLSLQTHNARSGAVPPPLAHLSMEGRHERRASDAASIRTTHLPIRGSDLHTRKSSAATTATITPETSIPHFSTVHRAEIFAQGRPGSSNSMAADDLKRLTRDDSPGSQSSAAGERRQSSRWSVISGIWNARRRDSTSRSPAPNDGQNGPPASPVKPRQSSIAASSKTAPPEIAVGPTCGPAGDARDDTAIGPRDPTPPPRDSADTLALSEQAGVAQKAQRTPDPSSAFESPVKTSINIDDGVIDVDVPLPDFITSFESAVSSPSSSGYLSASGFGTGLDAFEQSFRFAADGDVPLNVAGWLQHYHPDFVLQALPAQHGILDEIKESMRAEPTPLPLPSSLSSSSSSEDTPAEQWIDITSAIVADTATFTITRIRYRRLVRLKHQQPPHNNPAPTAVPTPPTTSTLATTTTSNPNTTPASATTSSFDVQLGEEFIEEPLVAFDDVLVDAVERVIASAGGGNASSTETTVSKVSSTSSSRSTSKRRERERERERRGSLSGSGAGPGTGIGSGAGSADLRCPGGGGQTQGASLVPGLGGGGGGMPPPQEVPRSQCKTVLLGALEDIIQDVLGEREQQQQQQQQVERERESPLREAVRGWIESVDFGGGGCSGGGD
ncbi:folliculin-interacting protein N-terminus-domain-containing protein [Parachaetomium inaequale]|uniref:Folliculin-interacting protein N-terminus-domain-containing protein n=1 Tax=Parachaetomium inaequale TaxID=2588326 RepID=A0AAN6SUS1_9PEZI|nr:folliculin-interacting protein N-terminus-domain-containing protein [Parachaetomium inaequale]